MYNMDFLPTNACNSLHFHEQLESFFQRHSLSILDGFPVVAMLETQIYKWLDTHREKYK